MTNRYLTNKQLTNDEGKEATKLKTDYEAIDAIVTSLRRSVSSHNIY